MDPATKNFIDAVHPVRRIVLHGPGFRASEPSPCKAEAEVSSLASALPHLPEAKDGRIGPV